MLLTKEVEVKWNPRNKHKYINLGYRFTNIGDSLYIKVDDLNEHSKIDVECLCDYCLDKGLETRINKHYANYIKERQKINKDACNECKQEKYKDYIALRQLKGELNLGDKGYFNFKENRLKELKAYIDKHETLEKIEDAVDGRHLYNSIIKHNEKPYELVKELGYNVNDLYNKRPNGYYSDFNILKNDIELLINKLNRFPTLEEIVFELKTGKSTVTRHGGIYEIKRKMNYNDSHDLVDKSGFFNSSVYELIVANFLIENKIPYLREQLISEDKKYRSDFMFTINENEIIHVELWGYLKTNKAKIATEYNTVREEKEALYNNLNIKYISIEPSIFHKMNYNKIQKSLTGLFSDIFKNHEFRHVDQELFIPGSEYSDDEIFNIIMSLSDDKDYFPEANVFREKYRTLYNQILKRYNNYSNFADKYNKKLKYKSNKYWTENKIFETFDHMITNYYQILSRTDSKKHLDDNIVSDYAKVSYSFRIKDLKLKYYGIKISNKNFIIPSNDLKWIKQVEVNLSRRGNIPYTPEQQEQAKQILEKYNAKTLTPTS